MAEPDLAARAEEAAMQTVLDMIEAGDRAKRLAILIELVQAARRSVRRPALTNDHIERLRRMSYLACAYSDKPDDHVLHEKMVPRPARTLGMFAGITVGDMRFVGQLADLIEERPEPAAVAGEDA